MIIVFARAPQPGKVKTRLVPLLGAEGAARLHARLVRHTVRTALAAQCGAVEVHVAGRRTHALFAQLEARHGLTLRSQTAGSLGERMVSALRRALRSAETAILIGSDCPALRAADLRRARKILIGGADAVLSPAEDGGYALIGMRRLAPQLFDGIDWGTEGVMRETRQRLRALGWSWRELRTVWDVDRPADVQRLRRSRPLLR